MGESEWEGGREGGREGRREGDEYEGGGRMNMREGGRGRGREGDAYWISLKSLTLFDPWSLLSAT